MNGAGDIRRASWRHAPPAPADQSCGGLQVESLQIPLETKGHLQACDRGRSNGRAQVKRADSGDAPRPSAPDVRADKAGAALSQSAALAREGRGMAQARAPLKLPAAELWQSDAGQRAGSAAAAGSSRRGKASPHGNRAAAWHACLHMPAPGSPAGSRRRRAAVSGGAGSSLPCPPAARAE